MHANTGARFRETTNCSPNFPPSAMTASQLLIQASSLLQPFKPYQPHPNRYPCLTPHFFLKPPLPGLPLAAIWVLTREWLNFLRSLTVNTSKRPTDIADDRLPGSQHPCALHGCASLLFFLVVSVASQLTVISRLNSDHPTNFRGIFDISGR
jgi:hypothetical protein